MIDFNWFSIIIDNWWELKITATFSFDCSSFININRLIVIDCHRLFRSCWVTADFHLYAQKRTVLNLHISPTLSCLLLLYQDFWIYCRVFLFDLEKLRKQRSNIRLDDNLKNDLKSVHPKGQHYAFAICQQNSFNLQPVSLCSSSISSSCKSMEDFKPIMKLSSRWKLIFSP